MLSVFHGAATILSIMLLLDILQPSYQYTYPCNSSVACGCSSNPASVTRIVGGESAGSSTWGWAVSISISGTSLCGGAILSSLWIISAAHCLSGVSASQVTIYAGSNTRYSGQSRVASAITVHPSYVSSTKVNDIALIRLSTALTMTSAVKTICIPSVSSTTLAAGEWPSADLYVIAVGWGTLWENGPVSSSLQQVTLQTIAYSASMCRSVLNNQQVQLCAGVPGGGKDTCQGDSGGPLVMYTASEQWVLVGLTSYGIGCARASYAGVYTRVAAYQSWIATTTSNAITNPTSSDSSDVNVVSSTVSLRVTETASISRLLSLYFSIVFIPFFLF